MDQNATTSTDTGSQPIGNEGQQNASSQGNGSSKFEKAIGALHQTAEEVQGGQSSSQDGLVDGQKTDTDTPNDWEKRYKDLQAQKDREVAEKEKAYTDFVLERLQENPDYIHALAQKNPALADKLIASSPEATRLGIKTYKDFQAFLQRQNMDPNARTMYDQEIAPLKEQLETLSEWKNEREKQELELAVSRFVEQHPDFQPGSELFEKAWDIFSNSKLSLEQCYKFAKHDLGIEEDINQREEKAWLNLQSKNQASAIASGTSRSASKGNRKGLNGEAVDFLEGIGAKKTLKNHGY